MLGIILGSAAVVMTYVTATVIFWRNPHLIHRKKRVSFSATHISHRGGSAEGYENTLKNFKKAVENGTNMLELDVRLTRDGQVVVHHDQDLKRSASSPHLISELDYAQLPPISSVIPIDTIPGETFNDPLWSDEDRQIPLLSQVFATFPNVPINIDIKDNNDELIRKVADLIQEYQRSEITVWGSFNNTTCTRCYKTNPNVGLFVSAKKAVLLCLATFTGILPYIPIKETHYEVLLPSSIKRRRLKQVSSLNFGERFLFAFIDAFLVNKPLISHLRKRGIHVYMWVCNTEDEFSECFDKGANGIMTDYPTRLRRYLEKHPARNN
ncbi:unnamed protein product [Allacma fusca]|uniref:GP-PDE domain-containing protein n=1 Tax=Allacma fusca TaxID=39272 RepID=A0A8J2KTQ6_9HEXA|nr:unnamed protein product [Allacma fusca]